MVLFKNPCFLRLRVTQNSLQLPFFFLLLFFFLVSAFERSGKSYFRIFVQLLHGLAKSRDKRKSLYLYYESAYGHQKW